MLPALRCKPNDVTLSSSYINFKCRLIFLAFIFFNTLGHAQDVDLSKFDVDFFGILEAEINYTDNAEFDPNTEDQSASDIYVHDLEIGLKASLADKLSATIIGLYEEDAGIDEKPFDVDVASMTLHNLSIHGLNLLIGQDYLPLGVYETNMVNDTLVLELLETHESMLMLSYEQSALNAGVYVFNGDIDKKNDTVNTFGITLSVSGKNYSAGVDYINNVADTDSLTGYVVNDIAAPEVEYSSAFVMHGIYESEYFVAIVEYVQADDIIDKTIASFGNKKTYAPEAWQVEFGFNVSDYLIAIAYQKTDGVPDLLPRSRASLSAGTDLYENVRLIMEYFYDEDYDEEDSGSGESSENFVVQLGISF